jgi:ABC-2 type transport system ATP-binding protein
VRQHLLPATEAGGKGLEVVELSKRYGDVVALDGCSLTVRPGRVVGLLGPNGAGKTTAMRCILGLVTPDRGDVRWCGTPIDREARLRFGYMPEERGLYPHMRVRAQLEYLARLSGLDRGTAESGVDRWLARLGLQDRGEARLDALSH